MAAISPTVYSGPYTANGSQTAFPFYFSVMDADGVVVTFNDQPVTAGYTVSFAGTSGTVSFGAPPAAGTIVLLQSNPDFTQTSEFENEGAYKLSTVNKSNRRSTIRDLFLFDKIKRALVAPLGVDLVVYMKALLGPAYKGDPGSNVMATGRFEILSGQNVSSGTDLIQTSGMTRGRLLADTTLTDGDVAANPLAIGKTANGRFFRRDEMDIDLREFGAVGNGEDLYPILTAARKYLLRYRKNVSSSIWGLGRLRIPPGNYTLSQTFHHDDGALRIEGPGSGMNGGQDCVIQLGGAFNGFQFLRGDDIRNPNRPKVADPSGSSLVGIKVLGTGAGTGAGIGVLVGVRMYIDAVCSYAHGLDGILISADIGASRGNANNFVVGRVSVVGNGRDGFATEGGDANAGRIGFVDASGNSRYGVREESFLGNGYGVIHAAGNVAGGFRGNVGANAGQVSYLYIESDQPASDWTGSRIVVSNTISDVQVKGLTTYNMFGALASTGGFAAGGNYSGTGRAYSMTFGYVINGAGFHRPIVSFGADSGEMHLEHNDGQGYGVWRIGPTAAEFWGLQNTNYKYRRPAANVPGVKSFPQIAFSTTGNDGLTVGFSAGPPGVAANAFERGARKLNTRENSALDAVDYWWAKTETNQWIAFP